jgi:hypothetical protein
MSVLDEAPLSIVQPLMEAYTGKKEWLRPEGDNDIHVLTHHPTAMISLQKDSSILEDTHKRPKVYVGPQLVVSVRLYDR